MTAPPTAQRLADIRAHDAHYGAGVPIGGSLEERRELLALVDSVADELKRLRKAWRAAAHALRTEVEAGVALRQSAEAKLARAEVLESHANQLTALLAELGAVDAPAAAAGEGAHV